MVAEGQGFATDRIGQWGEPEDMEITRERIAAYAAATNDDLEPHASGATAPPAFAIVPAFSALMEAMSSVIPPSRLMTVVHGEHDFRFHRPVEPGTILVSCARVIGVQTRSSGATVVVEAETRDTVDEQLVVEQYMTSVVCGAGAGGSFGTGAPGHGLDDALRGRAPDAEVAQALDADQTFRYAAASGDPTPVHLDDALARAMGLPGIVVHAMCTMAFASRAVIGQACPDDPTRLGRLAVRFSEPALPGETITTRVWERGAGRYAFETNSEAGAAVIEDGLAEVRD